MTSIESRKFSMVPIKYHQKAGAETRHVTFANEITKKNKFKGYTGKKGDFTIFELDRDLVDYSKIDPEMQESEIKYVKLMPPSEHYFQKHYTTNLRENIDVGYGVQYVNLEKNDFGFEPITKTQTDITNEYKKTFPIQQHERTEPNVPVINSYMGYKMVCPTSSNLTELEDSYNQTRVYDETKPEKLTNIQHIYKHKDYPFQTASKQPAPYNFNLGNTSYFSVLYRILLLYTEGLKSHASSVAPYKEEFHDLMHNKKPSKKKIYNAFHKFVVPQLANYQPGEQYIGNVLDRLDKIFNINHEIVSFNIDKTDELDNMTNVIKKIREIVHNPLLVSIQPYSQNKLVRSGWEVEREDLLQLYAIIVHSGKCVVKDNKVVLNGHYKCYINTEGGGKGWTEYNDDYYTPLTPEELIEQIKSEKNYKILAYLFNTSIRREGGSMQGGAGVEAGEVISSPWDSDPGENGSSKIIENLNKQIKEYTNELDKITTEIIDKIRKKAKLTKGGGEEQLKAHISKCCKRKRTLKKKMRKTPKQYAFKNLRFNKSSKK